MSKMNDAIEMQTLSEAELGQVSGGGIVDGIIGWGIGKILDAVSKPGPTIVETAACIKDKGGKWWEC